MNVFIQGMRRTGTTILYDAFLEDPSLRCFYEPLALQKVTMGGGSGVREDDLFSGARTLREDLRRRRYPSVDVELFNWGGPSDPYVELETDLPEHCRDYLGYLLDSAPEVLIKEVRMFRKVPELAALDPDAAFVQVVRDPRAVVASYLFGRDGRFRRRISTAEDFFEDRSGRWFWSSRTLSDILLEQPEYAHLGKSPPDILRVLLVWKVTFEEARREGLRCFGDRYLLLRHEEFRSAPIGASHLAAGPGIAPLRASPRLNAAHGTAPFGASQRSAPRRARRSADRSLRPAPASGSRRCGAPPRADRRIREW